jgi:hypothetical protein
MPQIEYGYQIPRGVPGGLVDLSNHNIISRSNGADAPGAMKYGMGVVQGDNPGHNVALPNSSAELSVFEGITQNGGVTEHQFITGEVILYPNAILGVVDQGKIWARVTDDADPAYSDAAYLVSSGTDAGLFTEDSSAGGLAVRGRFIGKKENGVAPVELFGGNA